MADVAKFPSGTVTFLFSDVEGSTGLLVEMGGEKYAALLAGHRLMMREAFARHGGVEVDTQGDSFFVAFPRASAAVACAAEVQAALEEGALHLRMAIHTGEPIVTAEGYVGIDVHRAARIAAVGHGGQVLVSQTTRDFVDAPLRDLGRHRLKDLTAPERLWQLGEGEFPQLRTLFRTNLPVQPTPLVGRERELADVVAHLETKRLLTLTGPGGVGKTRLALHAAAAVADRFRDGVWLVSLAEVASADLVPAALAQPLGVSRLPDDLVSLEALLILDNFEHLLDAAPIVATSLAVAPDVRFLVTSRERLAIRAEQEFPVPPMVPSDAAALFNVCARQIEPGFSSSPDVAMICERLDRLPLAVELAAARTKSLTPSQIYERLDRALDLLSVGTRDAPERQRTLRATLDWSYDLLPGRERRAFAALGAFPGTFDVEGAAVVAEADDDVLHSLIEKSLLRKTGDGRFFQLATIRELALERLEEPDRAHQRLAQYLLTLGARVRTASAREPEMPVRERQLLHERVAAELPNFRAAIEWAFARAPSLAPALALYSWVFAATPTEQERWVDQALALDPDEETRRGLIENAAHAVWRTASPDRAEPRFRRALTEAQRAGDDWAIVRLNSGLGAVLRFAGRFDDARNLYKEQLERLTSLGSEQDYARTLHNLGEVESDAGNLDRAREHLESSLAILRSHEDDIGVAMVLHGIGDLELLSGNVAASENAYREGLAVAGRRRTARPFAVHAVGGLAAVAALAGETERAGQLWGAVEAAEKTYGAPLDKPCRERYERALAVVADVPAFTYATARGATRSLPDLIDEILGDT